MSLTPRGPAIEKKRSAAYIGKSQQKGEKEKGRGIFHYQQRARAKFYAETAPIVRSCLSINHVSTPPPPQTRSDSLLTRGKNKITIFATGTQTWIAPEGANRRTDGQPALWNFLPQNISREYSTASIAADSFGKFTWGNRPGFLALGCLNI